jgi:2-methylcitrate dehydratase PrpD
LSETKALASWVVKSHLEDIPDDVRREALRAIVNYTGCALGGSSDAAVNIAMRAFASFFGPASASILGRKERADPLHAALMNGISSHV